MQNHFSRAKMTASFKSQIQIDTVIKNSTKRKEIPHFVRDDRFYLRAGEEEEAIRREYLFYINFLVESPLLPPYPKNEGVIPNEVRDLQGYAKGMGVLELKFCHINNLFTRLTIFTTYPPDQYIFNDI